jgi:hypothetical protein
MKNRIQPAGQVKTEARGIGTVTLPNRIFSVAFAAIIATAFALAFFVASAQAQERDVQQGADPVRGDQGEVVEDNGIEDNELDPNGRFRDSTHDPSRNSYCDITGVANGQSIDLPDCTDGSIYVTNRGSELTTDPEVERRGDRADEEDWQLGTGRDYVGDNNDLFASVLVLDLEVADLTSQIDHRGNYVASNYVIRDYDRVIVTVVDPDRNSTTDRATIIGALNSAGVVPMPVTGGIPLGLNINLTRPPYEVEPRFVADENDNDVVDRGDFEYLPVDIDGMDGGSTEAWIAYDSNRNRLDPTRGTTSTADDINIQFTIGLGADTDGNDSVFLSFNCVQGCQAPGGGQAVASVAASLSWERARFNSVVVVVDSDSGEEFDFVLWESDPDSGIFEGQLKLIYDTGTDEPETLEGTSLVSANINFETIDGLNVDRSEPFVDEIYVFAADGDSITITYDDQVAEDGDDSGTINDIDPDLEQRQATIRVDATPPEVEITVPVDNDEATDDESPTFEGTFSDDNSGLSDQEIAFVLDPVNSDTSTDALLEEPALSVFNVGTQRAKWSGAPGTRQNPGNIGAYPDGLIYPGETNNCERSSTARCIKKGEENIVDDDDFPDFTDGDTDVGFRITDDTYDDAEYSRYLNFQAYGVDLAGNVGLSDADDDEQESDLVGDEQVANPHSIFIDDTEIVEEDFDSSNLGDDFPEGALTGRGWDPSDLEVETNVRDSVLLIFPERLDNSTVEPSDFRYDSSIRGVDLEVERVTTIDPDDVEDEDLGGNDDGTENERLEEIVTRYVFLRLNGEIPSADEPTINIVGDIRDRAGNNLDDDIEVEVDDGLAPQVESVTLSEGSGLGDKVNELTKDDITIRVQVNEDIAASDVTIEFWQDEDDATTPERVVRRDDGRPRKVGGDGAYELDYSVGGSVLAGDVYVVVVVEDNRGNRSVFGAEDAGSGSDLGVDPTEEIEDHRDETVFEFDDEDPALDNDDDGLTGDDDTNDSDDISSSDPRKNLVIIFHEEVSQVNEAEIDVAGGGTLDIVNDLRSTDNEVWVFTPTEDWPLGEHTVRVVATDLADNESDDLDFTFEISEREDFNLSLSSGWNAVSLPSDPESGDIGSVFTNDGVTQVIAYEPWSRNPWRNAIRSGGSWTGSLDQIRGGIGYWVLSEDFGDQDITLISAGESSVVNVTPPTIRTFRGWNLVGALDPTRSEDIIEGETGDVLLTSGGVNYCLRDYLSSAGDVARAYEFDTIESTFDRIDISADACTNVDDTSEQAQAGKAYWIFIDDDIANPIAP